MYNYIEMTQPKEYFALISNKRKGLLIVNSWSCSNVMLHMLSFSISLVLHYLSCRPLKWIRGVFEKGSKLMRKVYAINGYKKQA